MRYIYSFTAMLMLFGVALIALAKWLEFHEKCPRRIKGYSKCNGKKCDHSPETVAQARKDTREEVETRTGV